MKSIFIRKYKPTDNTYNGAVNYIMSQLEKSQSLEIYEDCDNTNPCIIRKVTVVTSLSPFHIIVYKDETIDSVLLEIHSSNPITLDGWYSYTMDLMEEFENLDIHVDYEENPTGFKVDLNPDSPTLHLDLCEITRGKVPVLVSPDGNTTKLDNVMLKFGSTGWEYHVKIDDQWYVVNATDNDHKINITL